MSTNKLLLLSILLLLPIFVFGQIGRSVSKREIDRVGNKTYTSTTGEVTKVVNITSDGLSSSDAKFLFRKPDPVIDSILANMGSKYDSLEESILDIERLLRDVEETENATKDNQALSVRIIKRYRLAQEKKKAAEELADSLLLSDAPMEELASLYAKFDNKPTYYVNGIETPHAKAVTLLPDEIIERSIRIKNTASGNPNGEVWYTVSPKALKRLDVQSIPAINDSSQRQAIQPKIQPIPVTEQEVLEIKSESAPIDGNTRVISRSVEKVNKN